jgi:lysophospholipase L1-like esterase
MKPGTSVGRRSWRLLGRALAIAATGAWAAQMLSLLLVGSASVVTSLCFFAGIALATHLALGRLGGRLAVRASKLSTVQLAVASSFVSLTAADLYLRYGLAHYASYEEKGGFAYAPVYRSAFVNWLRSGREGLFVARKNASYQRRSREYAYAVSTNSEGLRDREYPERKPHGEFRILALGDSFTEGVGASLEATWPKQLESILNDGDSGGRVRVINGGVAGSDPFFAYALMRRLLRYSPDLVVVAINSGDVDDHVVRGGMERFPPGGGYVLRPGPAWERLYAVSFVARHVVHDVLGYDRLLLRPRERLERERLAVKDIDALLDDFGKAAVAHGFSLLFVFHPLAHELEAGRTNLAETAARVEAAGATPVLDLFARFEALGRDAEGQVRYYWPVDQHHTPAGYRVFAEAVAARVRQLGLPRAR